MGQHWKDRLNALALRVQRGERLNRADRRQLRKLLGRRGDLEWRLFGHGNILNPGDRLGRQVLANWEETKAKQGL